MTGFLDWLGALPASLLYLVIGLAAFVENIFPPLPADTAIAMGAFAAARGDGSAVGVWLATMTGNLGGALMMFLLGRRFGLPWLEKRFPVLGTEGGAARMEQQFKRHGTWGLVVSRFLPGVRAIVPPMAGALRIGLVRASIAIGLASAAWYALVCWLAFRAGANAEVLLAALARSQRTFGIIALAIAMLAAGIWWLRRRRSAQQQRK